MGSGLPQLTQWRGPRPQLRLRQETVANLPCKIRMFYVANFFHPPISGLEGSSFERVKRTLRTEGEKRQEAAWCKNNRKCSTALRPFLSSTVVFALFCRCLRALSCVLSFSCVSVSFILLFSNFTFLLSFYKLEASSQRSVLCNLFTQTFGKETSSICTGNFDAEVQFTAVLERGARKEPKLTG